MASLDMRKTRASRRAARRVRWELPEVPEDAALTCDEPREEGALSGESDCIVPGSKEAPEAAKPLPTIEEEKGLVADSGSNDASAGAPRSLLRSLPTPSRSRAAQQQAPSARRGPEPWNASAPAQAPAASRGPEPWNLPGASVPVQTSGRPSGYRELLQMRGQQAMVRSLRQGGRASPTAAAASPTAGAASPTSLLSALLPAPATALGAAASQQQQQQQAALAAACCQQQAALAAATCQQQQAAFAAAACQQQAALAAASCQQQAALAAASCQQQQAALAAASCQQQAALAAATCQHQQAALAAVSCQQQQAVLAATGCQQRQPQPQQQQQQQQALMMPACSPQLPLFLGSCQPGQLSPAAGEQPAAAAAANEQAEPGVPFSRPEELMATLLPGTSGFDKGQIAEQLRAAAPCCYDD